jgi:diaphanous 1
LSVSVQVILQTIHGLTNGLGRIEEEITIVKSSPKQTGDSFIHVMEPFIAQVRLTVDNLKVSGQALDSELKSLMTYYGESAEGSDVTKPEDFFGVVMSFSSALQKAAVEMHDAEAKLAATTPVSPTIIVPPTPTEPEDKQRDTREGRCPARPEINGVSSSQSLQPSTASQGRTIGRSTIGRGDLDQAIRSIRDGQRRARPSRPLSRMFLDGANDQTDRRASRVYDFPAS